MRLRVPLLFSLAIVLAGGCASETEPTRPLATTDAPGPAVTSPTGPTADPATDDPTDPAQQTFTIGLEGGQPVGGIEPIVVNLGVPVEIVVMADAAHQVHLHGYDLSVEVTAEDDARLTFVADIPGTFEIELEGEHRKIAELQVTP